MKGQIAWTDLTVDNAEQVRDFYQTVVGWKSEGVSMGEYEDFSMLRPDNGEAVAGVCHARGANSGLPPVWMIYLLVDDLEQSLKDCEALGGSIVVEPKSMAGSMYAVIKDPAGAVCALYEEAKK
ncbi:VOC family protein [Pleionea sp. CnH1-48]|uniref:VOC family protein n=1 Tax=Pleionea sp. CnH1-48 TaxID=2954494 RepID=UPI002096F40F|nr:VOC family protein [Pleionea sp. CnH1-48]MCO7224522.1 VOC family protein [Pleionea sp. CnH1-48]